MPTMLDHGGSGSSRAILGWRGTGRGIRHLLPPSAPVS
jgi:hypothetical protein